jgi:hypothetical protein
MLLDGVCYLQVLVVLVPGIVQAEEINNPAAAILAITVTLGWAPPPS